MIIQFTIRPIFHYNVNLKSDLFENNKEPLTMTVIAAPACHCSVQNKQNSCTLTIESCSRNGSIGKFCNRGGVRTGTCWRQMHLQSGNALIFTTLEL